MSTGFLIASNLLKCTNHTNSTNVYNLFYMNLFALSTSVVLTYIPVIYKLTCRYFVFHVINREITNSSPNQCQDITSTKTRSY